MPDEKGKLSTAELDQIRSWLQEREALRPCPICGFKEWGVLEQLFNLPLYPTNRGVFTAGGYPAVLVYCQRCTFARFHSAIVMGLAPSDETLAAEKKGAKRGA